MTVLGAPDLVVLTLTEFADQIHRIARAADLSLLVDADHGYGNALSVMRTVQELESAGVSALTIEDTELPQPFGAEGSVRLLGRDEGIGKMRAALAALAARAVPELIIVGRTSAAGIAGIDEAVGRARAYAETGVDAMFLVGVSTREQLETIRDAVELPLLLGGAGPELQDRDYLAAQGVRIALQGHAPFMAGVGAVHDALKALRDGVSPRDLPGLPDTKLVGRLTRQADYDGWIEEFLR